MLKVALHIFPFCTSPKIWSTTWENVEYNFWHMPSNVFRRLGCR